MYYILTSYILFFCLSLNTFSQVKNIDKTNKFVIKGFITDSDNQESLKRVTISILNTRLGTFSNLKGEFEIAIPKEFCSDSISIKISMISYETKINKILLLSDTIINFSLKPSKIETAEAVVYAEDPGIRLMRKVIARKVQQQEKLNTYSYNLYTKFVASTDTSTAGRRDSEQDTTINSILESFSLGYYKKQGKYFNEIIQKRQTVNIPPQANFVAFGTNINAYDDFVSILGEEVYSPFHPDAIDYYDFEIIGKQKFEKSNFLDFMQF